MNKLRYIKDYNILPEQFVADSELGEHITLDHPTLFGGYPKQTFLMLTGWYDPEKYIYVEKIPSDVSLTRVLTAKNQEAGTICWSKGTATLHFHLDPESVGLSPEEVSKAMLSTALKTVRQHKVTASMRANPHRQHSNDLVVDDRKFCGICPIKRKNEFLFGMPLTLEMDYEVMRSVYRLDTTKMMKHGNIKDIKEVVMGLDEVVEIDRDKFLDDFAENLAKRFDLELFVGKYSDREQEALDKALSIVSTPDWVMRAKR